MNHLAWVTNSIVIFNASYRISSNHQLRTCFGRISNVIMSNFIVRPSCLSTDCSWKVSNTRNNSVPLHHFLSFVVLAISQRQLIFFGPFTLVLQSWANWEFSVNAFGIWMTAFFRTKKGSNCANDKNCISGWKTQKLNIA